MNEDPKMMPMNRQQLDLVINTVLDIFMDRDTKVSATHAEGIMVLKQMFIGLKNGSLIVQAVQEVSPDDK